MPTIVFADSIWPDSVCNTSSAYMLGNAQNRIVHVYVENDFAAELSSCTPTTNDDGKIAEDEVRHRIDEAIQKWNQQAVGLTFEPAFSTDAFVASIFEPSESPCDISQPATTEIHEVTDNDL